jgi:hypothetical protein
MKMPICDIDLPLMLLELWAGIFTQTGRSEANRHSTLSERPAGEGSERQHKNDQPVSHVILAKGARPCELIICITVDEPNLFSTFGGLAANFPSKLALLDNAQDVFYPAAMRDRP